MCHILKVLNLSKKFSGLLAVDNVISVQCLENSAGIGSEC